MQYSDVYLELSQASTMELYCGKLFLLEIRDAKDPWKQSRMEVKLNAFRQSPIPQKQFIILLLAVNYSHEKVALQKNLYFRCINVF